MFRIFYNLPSEYSSPAGHFAPAYVNECSGYKMIKKEFLALFSNRFRINLQNFDRLSIIQYIS